MNALVAVLTLVLLAAVMAVVSRPLLAARTREGSAPGTRKGKPDEPDTPERAELEAAREAKYREIRDAELDYRTGKLSQEDYEAVNGALRAEALEILNKLESSEGGRVTNEGRATEEDRPAEEDQVTEEGEVTEGDRIIKEDQVTNPAK